MHGILGKSETYRWYLEFGNEFVLLNDKEKSIRNVKLVIRKSFRGRLVTQ